MRTDLIADMLTLVRNASVAKKEKVNAPASKINAELLRVLKEAGLIENYRRIDDAKVATLRIYLKYINGIPALTNLKRISRPGLRVYSKNRKVRRAFGTVGIAVVSTSKGVMTSDEAKEAGVGGEVLCYAW